MRYRAYLRERYRALLGYTSGILAIVGLVHLLPLLAVIFYPDEARYGGAFLLAGLPLVAIGGVLWRLFIPKNSINLTVQEGAVIVTIVWIVACLLGSIPFMLIDGMNFTLALFESTSGYTTTGLSVVDVTQTPNILLFFRTVTHLAGGAGFAIIAVTAAASSLAMGVSAAEGRSDQLAPNVRRSATIILTLYLSYIAVGAIALRLAGMGGFDAINHSISAVATGGFSTKPESVGHWDNVVMEAIIIVLMLLGSINFLIAYTVIRGKPGVLIRSAEVRSQTFLTIAAIILITALTTGALYSTVGESVRIAAFEVVSAITSTGFAAGSPIYSHWNDFGLLILTVLMAIGGGAGSTSGGIK